MRAPLALVPQFFGSLVFDRRTSRYLPFDAGATAVLRRLLADPDAGADAPAFHAYFAERGFFDLDGHLAAEVVDLTPPPDHLAGPLAVHLQVSDACNLRCAHCFAGELADRHAPLTLVELDSLFSTLARLGSFRLGLTGGEPLLRRDLFEIIDAATARGLSLCVTTNGLLLTEEIAREFGRRDFVWLNVSLEGATATSNDAIRGAGTFDRVRDRVALLVRHARFTLAFTMTSRSAGEVTACAALAREWGAHAAVFRPLYPVGTASRHPELMPSYGQYSGALERLTGDLHESDPFSPRLRGGRQSHVTLNAGCGAGSLVCSISVDGEVSPCSFLGPAHAAGSLRREPFEVIWNRSHVFTRLRAAEGEAFCGGCRARALADTGSVHGRDPWFDDHVGRGRVHPQSNVEVP